MLFRSPAAGHRGYLEGRWLDEVRVAAATDDGSTRRQRVLMAITNTTFRPYFAAAVAPGTYTITCSASGLPGIPNFTATVTVSGYRYFIPNASSPDSILSDVVTALNAASFGAGWSGLFGITYVGASTVEGITYRLTYSAHKFSILVGSATFPLPAIGMTQASHPSTVTAPYYIANTQQPSRTWFPKVVANDLGQLPMMTQVTASEPTSDGSTVFVNQGDDPTTRPQWQIGRAHV